MLWITGEGWTQCSDEIQPWSTEFKRNLIFCPAKCRVQKAKRFDRRPFEKTDHFGQFSARISMFSGKTFLPTRIRYRFIPSSTCQFRSDFALEARCQYFQQWLAFVAYFSQTTLLVPSLLQNSASAALVTAEVNGVPTGYYCWAQSGRELSNRNCDRSL